MDIKISPSMLASDFANLENELKKCKTGGFNSSRRYGRSFCA